MKTGIVPSDWKEALVTPVFKKGEHYNAANYRPISLTSISCEILEHVLVGNIMDHLETKNSLYPQQHGFRKYRSREPQLLEFIDEFSAPMESGKPTDIIITDFAKAFHRVNHSLLVHKANHYSIQGNTKSWIANFLHNQK